MRGIQRALLTALATTVTLSLPLGAQAQDTSAAARFHIFMLVKTTPAWLALDPKARFAYLEKDVQPLLEEHAAVRMRFYDTEAYNSRVTDVIVWDTTDLAQYQSLVEKLRETRFWGTYFEVVEILPGLENAYAAHYDVEPLGSGRSPR
jgi:hypothetical protein